MTLDDLKKEVEEWKKRLKNGNRTKTCKKY